MSVQATTAGCAAPLRLITMREEAHISSPGALSSLSQSAAAISGASACESISGNSIRCAGLLASSGMPCPAKSWAKPSRSASLSSPHIVRPATVTLKPLRASHCRPSSVGRNEPGPRSEEHTSELQSRRDLVCRLLLEKKKKKIFNLIFLKKKKKKKK